MKKFIALVMVVLLMTAILAGCAPAATDAPAAPAAPAEPAAPAPEQPGEASVEEDRPIRIGVAFATEVASRFRFEEKFMLERAEELGVELLVQWANYEAARQESQVENLITQGIDALILIGTSNMISPLVYRVKDVGIPVIAYDMFINDAPLDAFLNRDDTAAGEMQIRAAIEHTGGSGNYVILKGEPASSVAQAMGEAYHDVLQDYPDITVVVEQFHAAWSAEDALMTAENAITLTDGNIDAFVASADVLALGIIPAVTAAGLDGEVFISGMDCEIPAMQLIDQGVISISVWTKIDSMARQAIDVAYNLARGTPFEYDQIVMSGSYEVPMVYVPIVGVTRENLLEWVEEIAPEGWVTREEVFGN